MPAEQCPSQDVTLYGTNYLAIINKLSLKDTWNKGTEYGQHTLHELGTDGSTRHNELPV